MFSWANSGSTVDGQAIIQRVKLNLLPKRSAICAILYCEQGIGKTVAGSHLSGLNVPSVSKVCYLVGLRRIEHGND